MYKANPNLGIFLAEQALRTRLKGIVKDDGRKDIIRFCREAGKGKNCQKLAYRLQRLEINRVVVDTLLHTTRKLKDLICETPASRATAAPKARLTSHAEPVRN